MNAFIIPSWYSNELPYSGIFFKEQTALFAQYRPDWNLGISTWGSHDPRLWITKSRPLEALIKLSSPKPIKFAEKLLAPNCVEFLSPAYTWTRKIKKGNIAGIIEANDRNLERFILHFGKPDIIHAHVAYPAGMIAYKLSIKHKIPFVITEHMSPFPMPSFQASMKELLLKPMHEASKVFVVSQNLKNVLKGFDVNAIQVSNFIDDQFFYPKPNKNDSFTFLSIGRLEAQKNYSFLLLAAAALKKKIPNFILKIIGTGSNERALKKQSKQLGLDANICWLGEYDRDQLRDELQRADAFVLSSDHENQPVSILEAMACGKPVITTNWKGADEMVHEGVGLISEIGNHSHLAVNMKKAVEEPFSPEVIRTDFEKRYNAKKHVSKLEKSYLEVIQNYG